MPLRILGTKVDFCSQVDWRKWLKEVNGIPLEVFQEEIL